MGPKKGNRFRVRATDAGTCALRRAAVAIHQGAAWKGYLRDKVPDNTRRQVFTGGSPKKTATSHDAMRNLRDKAYATWANMRRARQAGSHEAVHLRSTLKLTIKQMGRRNHYFQKYTQRIEQPPADKAKPTSTSG
jgi:hypothetical protein